MPLGWGFVGTGRLADVQVAPAVGKQPDSRIVAVYDVNQAVAHSFAGRYGGTVHDSLPSLLDDPAVDIVYIATPNIFHKEQVISAARAGKHVLCEKPMALTLDDGREMVTAARSAGRLLGIGFHLRHKPSNIIARNLVAEGRIGRPYFGEMERGSSKQAFPHDTWRSQVEMVGGGAAVNQGTHVIDMIRFLTGQRIANISTKVDRQPIEDVQVSICTLEGGALVMLASHSLWYNTRPDFVLCGDSGWLKGVNTICGLPNDSVELYDASGTTVLPGSDANPYYCEVDDFVKAVLGKAPLNGDGEDGLHVIAVVQALYRSVRESRSVDVEPIW